MNAMRAVNEANGNCKSFINEKGSDYQKNIDIFISYGKTNIIKLIIMKFYYDFIIIVK